MDSVIIIGMKHSGKSSLGKGLANNLSLPFFDTDEIIENQTGIKVRELFVKQGESSFKKAEFEACKYLLEKKQNHENLVISTGGGICDNIESVEILKKFGKFILLEVPENICLERILRNSKKTGSLPGYISRENPKSLEDIQQIFHQFYERRMKSYKEITDFSFSPHPEASKQENVANFVKFVKNIFML